MKQLAAGQQVSDAGITGQGGKHNLLLFACRLESTSQRSALNDTEIVKT